jgi:hypothetical protein
MTHTRGVIIIRMMTVTYSHPAIDDLRADVKGSSFFHGPVPRELRHCHSEHPERL